MSVRAVFDFDTSEHFRASRAVTRLTPARYYSWVLAAGCVAMLAWSLWSLPPDEDLRDKLLTVGPWLLLAIFWACLIPFTQWRLARKMPKRDPSVLGPQERIVDTEGFHSRGNGVSLDVPWHAVQKVVETDEFFFFFYNKRCAYYLPTRAISGHEAMDVRDLSRAALKDHAKLRLAEATPA